MVIVTHLNTWRNRFPWLMMICLTPKHLNQCKLGMNFPVKQARQPEVGRVTVEIPHSTAIFPLRINSIVSEPAEVRVDCWKGLEHKWASYTPPQIHTSTDPSRLISLEAPDALLLASVCVCVCVCVGGLLCLHVQHVWAFKHLPKKKKSSRGQW